MTLSESLVPAFQPSFAARRTRPRQSHDGIDIVWTTPHLKRRLSHGPVMEALIKEITKVSKYAEDQRAVNVIGTSWMAQGPGGDLSHRGKGDLVMLAGAQGGPRQGQRKGPRRVMDVYPWVGERNGMNKDVGKRRKMPKKERR